MGLCWGLTTRQPLWVILRHLPEKKEKRDYRDEKVGHRKKRNWNEREETGEIKTFPSSLTRYKDSEPCPTVGQYQLDAPVT